MFFTQSTTYCAYAPVLTLPHVQMNLTLPHVQMNLEDGITLDPIHSPLPKGIALAISLSLSHFIIFFF